MNAVGSLKARMVIRCDTCGVKLRRSKTFLVVSGDLELAKTEVSEQVIKWQKSLKGQNCSFCQSVIDSLRDSKTARGL